MPINTGDDHIEGQRRGQWLQYDKGSLTGEGIGTWQSLWKANGGPPAGANPPAFSAGSGYVPTKETTGALNFGNPTAPDILVMSIMDVDFAIAGKFQLCDRLWACSGFGTVITSLQSITTPGTLPAGRDPLTGADVLPFLEVYTAPGGTGATWTVTGTDGLGNTNRTWTYTHPANAESVGQMFQLLPGGASPASTVGMRVPVLFQASGTSGTAGDIGITLIRRLGNVVARTNDRAGYKDFNQLGMKQVYDDACLMGRVRCSAGTTGLIIAEILLAQR